MPFRRPQTHQYTTVGDLNVDKDAVAWYWRLTALASSWMILGGYLVLPAVYDKNPQLRFSNAVLNIFVVTLLTAGYSFTMLLCYAVRNPIFQSESIFLPALASSALGLLTVLYNFAHSSRYVFNAAAIIAITLSASATVIYGFLLILSHRHVVQLRESLTANYRSGKLYQDSAYYSNYLANMYPTARTAETPIPPSEDDMVNQQMALLLMKNDSGASPDASSTTFRIDLPDEPEHEVPGSQVLRPRNSAPEIIRDPRDAFTQGRSASMRDGEPARARIRAESLQVGDSPGRGRNLQPPQRARALSREERRMEIELGRF